MVNIVVVSHSALLAQGVAELAQQMAQGGCQLALAAGVDDVDHPIGTDTIKVMSAIESVYDPTGVLVLMDLGSAVLSAETALELLDPEMATHVSLCAAPLVEGTLAAVVAASAGASLQQVRAEAMGALAAKINQLGEETEQETTGSTPALGMDAKSVSWLVQNPNGLHVRPAAKLVETLAPFDAELLLEKNGQCVNPRSLNQLAILQVRKGDTIRLLASGIQAEQVLAAFSQLAQQHFGESVAEEDKRELAGVMVPTGTVRGPIMHGLPAMTAFIPRTISLDQVLTEQQRLQQALLRTVADLEGLAAQVAATVGDELGAIFSAHALLIGDEELQQAVEQRIASERVCAESALQSELMAIAADYLALDDEYLRVRELDIRDILNRVLGYLTGLPVASLQIEGGVLLLAKELMPSALASLNRHDVKGICLSHGSMLSHSAILSRALAIPMAVGVSGCLDVTHNGMLGELDTVSGVLRIKV
ncbi:dihydroxyacetone kinase phosphoryl donor subunit DhaM [Yersinia ruckeri]|uniref:dihydroxyacetone kinase phosphoryl donor subunit DhaM n=1 Tax=Yersinia ruckeri TaxID=29486 RepID=UPI0005EA901A|nr:dihydroxyacetone kinase phosphoryl donor subunit DhaM [Yersinia ruckeri]AKA39161.1 dihydroxyacetone kinase [Yersinia ruckeri]MCW6651066.1 dihydroxyacetone kinase phosphoryl donor subunit DhaM [Yersinia ruckeri]